MFVHSREGPWDTTYLYSWLKGYNNIYLFRLFGLAGGDTKSHFVWIYKNVILK